MSPVLRLHGLDSLNAAPLQWGLAVGPPVGRRRVELVLGTPAGAAAALAAGRADVALIPSIELQRIGGLTVVPGICVAARRRVRSVLLLARRDLSQLADVAVDCTSRTSAVLVRILLERRFGIRPRYVERPPDAGAMLREHDAALLIADAALRPAPAGVQVHDLAELWCEWTGLPFVFAVWAARGGVDIEAVTRRLERARADGRRNLSRLVAEHASRHGHPDVPTLMAYLGELLHYNLGPEEERSLDRFFQEAHDLGLLAGRRLLHVGSRSDAASECALTGGGG